MMDVYRVGEDSVRISGESFNLTSNCNIKGKKMLKIQIDSNISNQIGPKDVLESLKVCEDLKGERTLRIKEKDYLVCFLKGESDIFVLGEKPSESFDAVDNFFGTIHVSSLPST